MACWAHGNFRKLGDWGGISWLVNASETRLSANGVLDVIGGHSKLDFIAGEAVLLVCGAFG